MDKFYVKSKRNNNSTSKAKTSTMASTVARTSEEIFQISSNTKRLCVGNIYTKIRHKFEDNLSPKISVKMYKSEKHSKSLTALSSIGATTGKYTLKNKNKSYAEKENKTVDIQNGKLKLNDGNSAVTCSEDIQQNPYAECYNTSAVSADFSKSSASYIDSEEDDSQLSLNFVKTSLEDEIFQELEKAAHDENKLDAVLKTFDKIIFDYNDPQLQTELQAMKNINSEAFDESPNVENTLEEETTKDSVNTTVADITSNPQLNDTNLDDRQIQTKQQKKLQKSSSSLSLSRRKCYQSPDSPCLRQMRRAFEKHERSKSVWELSNDTKIPILKALPLKTRSKSFCYNNSDEINSGSMQLESYRKMWKPSKPYLSINKNQKSQDCSAKIKKIERTPSKKKSPTNKGCQSATYLAGRPKKTDELLDKCLEKGQQILRKVESINIQGNHKHIHGTKSLMQTNTTKKRTKNSPTIKRNQQLNKLNYANEEKISMPTLESCKIIAPIFGETSDKNIGLLVQVTNSARHASHKQRDSFQEATAVQLQPNMGSDLKSVIKYHESDSDDSGHISNENMETIINQTSTSVSSSSLSMNLSDNTHEAKSPKISEVLQVFESIAQQQSSTQEKHIRISEKIDLNSDKNIQVKPKHMDSIVKYEIDQRLRKNVNGYRYCTTYKRLEIEPFSVIRTHVEIFPNYTKEVTLRLH